MRSLFVAFSLILGAAGGAGAHNIYYGNFHAHTNVSDGIGTPEEAYAYARDVAGIDILALTDHTHMLTATEWVDLGDAADQYNEDGVFIALRAQEFGILNDFGHINIFGVPYRNPYATTNLPATYNFILDNNGIGSFCHPNPSYGTWFDGFNFLSSFVESMKGIEMRCGLATNNYTDEVTYALDKGWKLAFFGNQDNHQGMWGNQQNTNDGGAIYLTGVLADNLTKDEVLDALRARRFFCQEEDPPGDRIKLWFWANGHDMGSTFETPGAVTFTAHAEAVNGVSLFNRGELFRDGVLLDSQVLIDTTIDYEYEDVIAEGESHYYYLRVRQVDGDFAWSAPVWVQQADISAAPEPIASGSRVRLLPTSPNPFFPRTQISYESPGVLEGPIELAIHDIAGRRVRNLGLVPATTGVHRLTWDGRDDRGNILASGIYLIRLRTDRGQVDSQRILLTH